MSDGFEVPAPRRRSCCRPSSPVSPRSPTGSACRTREVFDTGRLSVASGVPEPVVKALLSGRPGG